MINRNEGFLGGSEADRAAWLSERLFWSRAMQEPALVLVPQLDGLTEVYHEGEPYWGPGCQGSVRLDVIREIVQAPGKSLDQICRAFGEVLIPQARSRTSREPYWQDSARALLRCLCYCTAHQYAYNLSLGFTPSDRIRILTGPLESATELLLELYEQLSEDATYRPDTRSTGTLPIWVDQLPQRITRPLRALLGRNSIVTAGSILSETAAGLEFLGVTCEKSDLTGKCDRVFHNTKLRGPFFIDVESLAPETLGLIGLAARLNGVNRVYAYELDRWPEDLLPSLSTSKGSLAWTACRPCSQMMEPIIISTEDISWSFAFDSANRNCFSERVQRTTGQLGGLLTSQPYEEPSQLPEGLLLRHDGISWQINSVPRSDTNAVEVAFPQSEKEEIPFLGLIRFEEEGPCNEEIEDDTPVL